MRIMWSSNAPWAGSGYGTQTKRLVPGIRAAGHDVALFCWHGLEGGQLNLEGSPIYPKAGHPFGVDVLGAHAKDFKADIIITLIDAWVQDPTSIPPDIKWCPYFPIDSDPCSPKVLEKVRHAYERISMSKYGGEHLEKEGLSHLYCPHVVPTQTFKPGPKNEARSRLRFPQDKFVASVVAANKGVVPRKGWPWIFEAWGKFVKRHPDSVLYLHTFTGEGGGDSCDLAQLARYHECGENVLAVDQYQLFKGLDEKYVVDVMNASDVLLNPSMGEGFGIPVLEAQACGCPVIVGDWTAMPELCWAGWKVPKDKATPFWLSNYGAYMYLVDPDCLDGLIEKAHAAVGQRGDLSRKARTGAMQYDTQKVLADHWLPALDKIEQRLMGERASLKLVQV